MAAPPLADAGATRRAISSMIAAMMSVIIANNCISATILMEAVQVRVVAKGPRVASVMKIASSSMTVVRMCVCIARI